MGTLIRMKAEVNNPELPVVTEQGILPYYTGIYVNNLADNGITLTQTEINAVTAFVNTLKDANVLDKIDTFYPFIGDANIPLIGNKELGFTDITSANTNLDFVSGKLRGIKGQNTMQNVKYKDLTTFNKGVIIGGSMITKTPTSHPSNAGTWIRFITSAGNTPALQCRLQFSDVWRFRISQIASSTNNAIFNPAIPDSNVQNNYSFVYGIVNDSYSTEALKSNETLIKNNTILSNSVNSTFLSSLPQTDFREYYIGSVDENAIDRVVTTLAFFNEILSAPMSKAFCEALDTFTAAVGKTVTVE